MILQRLATSIRKQDWFTVLIETLIVVLGVFLGIQLGNWNADRQTRAEAAQYAERLRADLATDARNYVILHNYYRGALKSAEIAYGGLTGAAEISDADLLVAAFRASQYNWAERHRTTFDELVASGSLELIEDPAYRARVAAYYSQSLLADVSQSTMNSEYRRAFRMFAPPDLHDALAIQCGDREGSGGRQAFTIDYTCALDWPAAEVAKYAALLRADEDMVPLLRLQISNLKSRDFELAGIYDFYGLDEFIAAGGAR